MAEAPTIQTIMTAFAERTRLKPASHSPSRYLWTDAFAVFNYLELFRQTGDENCLQEATGLVDQVHWTLGRHRADDPRTGWISGLNDQEGKEHPTRAGLRIGKKLNERGPHAPFDERLEWDRDGQYFHYLTKWMQALDAVARVTKEAKYERWAIELAKAAHAAFAHRPFPRGPVRLCWKMSIDLSHPLVPSMGQHDPLDGLITCRQLQAGAESFSDIPPTFNLDTEITELTALCKDISWETNDPLGIGGLLTDACRLTQLVALHNLDESNRLEQLLDEAAASLAAWNRNAPLQQTAPYRLAFRELGLSIGLHAIEKMHRILDRHPHRFPNHLALETHLTNLTRFLPLQENIESFWIQPTHQQSDSWMAHRDINSIMLATSLAPLAYLTLAQPSPAANIPA
jgi:hypothetical protein